MAMTDRHNFVERGEASGPVSQQGDVAPKLHDGKTKTLILFSGGADSVLMLLLAWKMKREINLLCFDYGQIHEKELDYGLQLVEELERDLKVRVAGCTRVNLQAAFGHTSSRLTHPQGRKYPGVHEMHLPGRNGVFITTALGIAEAQKLDEVWIGCDYSDRVGLFPDCAQEWIVRMDEVAQRNGSRPLRVKAPLLGLSKEDVKALLVAEGIDLSKVFSGYSAPK